MSDADGLLSAEILSCSHSAQIFLGGVVKVGEACLPLNGDFCRINSFLRGSR